MVNSCQNQPVTYGYQPVTNIPANKSQPPKKRSAMPFTLGGLALGATTGALVGWESNPYITKSGSVVDNFAQKAFDIFINKNDDSAKKVYNESIKVLEGLKKVKTPEELKTLLNANKDFAEEMCKGLRQTPEKYIETITKDNLQANKETIISQIKGENGNKLQQMKNQIQACWDKATSSFKKADKVSQETFDAINEATKGTKNKLIGKYALIGGLGTAVATFIIYHIIKTHRTKKQSQAIAQKNVQIQQY